MGFKAKKSKILNRNGRHFEVVRNDTWLNPVTGIRTARDKMTAGQVKPVAPNADRQEPEDIYHGNHLGSRIVDELVGDMVRKWIRLNVSVTDNAEADDNVQAADDMMQALDDLDARTKLKEALTWSQVFGGSIVFIGADDGGGSDHKSMAEPLNLSRIRTIKSLDVYDRWDVEIESEYSDPLSPKYGQPETYRLNTISSVRGTEVKSAIVIHETRTLRFDGVRVNRRRRQRNSGWHDSVYTRIKQVLSDFDQTWASAAALMSDFAQAVFKSPGLPESLAEDGDGVVMDRLRNMDMCRSTVRFIPIDSDEELERKETPISGMPDMLSLFILLMCSAARMPVTKLFGQSPSGLNTTAEGDLAFWYDRVSAQQDSDLRAQLEYLILLLWLAKDGPTKGVEPKSWSLDFEPLWQLSQDEETKSRKTQAEADQMYIDVGVLTPDEVARSRFGGDRYSYETQLDEDARAEEEKKPELPPELPPQFTQPQRRVPMFEKKVFE